MGESRDGGAVSIVLDGGDLQSARNDLNQAKRDLIQNTGPVVAGDLHQTINQVSTGDGLRPPSLDEVLRDLGERPGFLAQCDLSRMRRQLMPDRTLAGLLVSCEDQQLALEGAWAWIEEEFPDRRRLGLHLDRGTALGLEVLDELVESDLGPSVVLVEIVSEHRFLNALLDSGTTRLTPLLDELEGASIALVFAVRSSLLGSDRGARKKSPIQHLQVDWLWQLLARNFEPKRASELETRLEDQRRLGKWPGPLAELCDEVSRLLEVSPASLEEAVTQKEGNLGEGEEIAELLPTERGLEHYAVAVAVFFARLPFPIFQTVLMQAIRGETQRDEAESYVLRDGVALSVRDEERRPLAELWREDADGLLRRCGLENAPSEERGIRLARAGIRQDLREHLLRRHPKVFADLVAKLTQPSFLLGEDLPQNFVSDLVALAVEGDFGTATLGPGWLDEALAVATASLPPPSRAERLALDYTIRRSEVEDTTADPWRAVARRFARILEAIVALEDRQGLVERWLRRAVRFRMPSPASQAHPSGASGGLEETTPNLPPLPTDPKVAQDLLLFEVILELCRASGWDWLPWLRLWADRGDPRISDDLGRILLGWVLDSRTRAWEVLEPITGWLPGAKAPEEQEATSRPTDELPGETVPDTEAEDATETEDSESPQVPGPAGESTPEASQAEREGEGDGPVVADPTSVGEAEGAGHTLPPNQSSESPESTKRSGPLVTEPELEESRDGAAGPVASALLMALDRDALDYRFGTRRRQCPLFRDLRFAPSSKITKNRLERLVHWLRQVQAEQERRATEPGDTAVYRQVAESLLTWCYVLEGVDLDPKRRSEGPVTMTETSPVLEGLLEIVAEQFSRVQKKGFLDYWHLKGDAFLDLSTTEEFRNHRNVTSQLRRKTRELRRRFKSIDRAKRRAAKSPRRRRRA